MPQTDTVHRALFNHLRPARLGRMRRAAEGPVGLPRLGGRWGRSAVGLASPTSRATRPTAWILALQPQIPGTYSWDGRCAARRSVPTTSGTSQNTLILATPTWTNFRNSAALFYPGQQSLRWLPRATPAFGDFLCMYIKFLPCHTTRRVASPADGAQPIPYWAPQPSPRLHHSPVLLGRLVSFPGRWPARFTPAIRAGEGKGPRWPRSGLRAQHCSVHGWVAAGPHPQYRVHG